MTWFQVDDGLGSHPKVTRLKRGATRERAMGLWVLAGSWSARYLTEGQIPREQIDELGCTIAAANWLLGNGMWHNAGHTCDQCPQPLTKDGFIYHDWTQANHTMQEVLDKRAAKAAAGAKGGRVAAERRRSSSKTEAAATASATEVLVAESKQRGSSPVLSSPVLPTNPSLLTLVCRRLFGDARKSTTDEERADLWLLWAETAGQGVDLETELRAWLIHNGDTDLRNAGAALLGWLRTAAKRASIPALPGCDRCVRGWLPDEFGQPSANRCVACRSHLQAVGAS